MTRALADHPELIVVLGGGMTAGGEPAPSTVARTAAASVVARERPDAAVICSGSHGGGRRPRRSEAASMAEAIAATGVDPSRIFLEDESRDTIGNAAHVAERYLAGLAPRPIHLVTSPFHLARSVETFRLVLGATWPIAGRASAAVADDADRAPSERRFLEQTRLFLADTTPGDIRGIVAKVRARPAE